MHRRLLTTVPSIATRHNLAARVIQQQFRLLTFNAQLDIGREMRELLKSNAQIPERAKRMASTATTNKSNEFRTDRAPKSKRERILRKKELEKRIIDEKIDEFMKDLFPSTTPATNNSTGMCDHNHLKSFFFIVIILCIPAIVRHMLFN